jgi:hypothetical protein
MIGGVARRNRLGSLQIAVATTGGSTGTGTSLPRGGVGRRHGWVVAPRPQIVRRCFVGGPTEIAHHPHGRPQSTNERIARKNHVDFHNTTRKAKLIPTLDHTTTKIGLLMFPFLNDRIVPVPRCFFEHGRNFQIPIIGGNAGGIVKLHTTTTGTTRIIIRPIQSRPQGIVAVGKGSVGNVEFIRHDLYLFVCYCGIRWGL